MGLPLRIAVLVGLALSQIGEFSFVLSRVGLEYGLVSQELYRMFLDVAVLTMVATSSIIAVSAKLADAASRLPFYRSRNQPSSADIPDGRAMKDHLIIIGYGVNGRNVALSARSEGIPYIIVDIDPETARSELRNGEPIRYGDATQEHVLLNAGIKSARVMVVAISDRSATRRVTDLARRLNPDIYIIARTRYIHEMSSLYRLGANEVIPEEYETSVEIFCRVLERYQVPRERIDSFVNHIRADGYEMFRSISNEPYCSSELDLVQNEFVTIRVLADSPAAGRSLADIGFKEMGVSLLAVNRGAQVIDHPPESFVLNPDDVAIILGSRDRISSLSDIFGPAAASGNVAS